SCSSTLIPRYCSCLRCGLLDLGFDLPRDPFCNRNASAIPDGCHTFSCRWNHSLCMGEPHRFPRSVFICAVASCVHSWWPPDIVRQRGRHMGREIHHVGTGGVGCGDRTVVGRDVELGNHALTSEHKSTVWSP